MSMFICFPHILLIPSAYHQLPGYTHPRLKTPNPPCHRQAFIAKRKNQPETPSPKRRRLEREDSTALWKRFRGDLAYRCQGPEAGGGVDGVGWAGLEEDLGEDEKGFHGLYYV